MSSVCVWRVRASLLLWVLVGHRVGVEVGYLGSFAQAVGLGEEKKEREVLGTHRLELRSISATPGRKLNLQNLLPTPSAISLAQALCHCRLRTWLIRGPCVCCLHSFPVQAPTHPRPQLVQTHSRRAAPLICPPLQHPPAFPFLHSLSTALCPPNVSHTLPRP